MAGGVPDAVHQHGGESKVEVDFVHELDSLDTGRTGREDARA